eukprot:g66287.t1
MRQANGQAENKRDNAAMCVTAAMAATDTDASPLVTERESQMSSTSIISENKHGEAAHSRRSGDKQGEAGCCSMCKNRQGQARCSRKCAIISSVVALVVVGAIAAAVVLTGPGATLTARFTFYASYPECCNNPTVDQTECGDYSGCQYQGQFALFEDTKSLSWVQSNNIIAFYDNHDRSNLLWDRRYGGKRVQLSKSWAGKTYTWESTIVDQCGNEDCENCCAKNARGQRYLVDLEYWSALAVFGTTGAVDDTVEMTFL